MSNKINLPGWFKFSAIAVILLASGLFVISSGKTLKTPAECVKDISCPDCNLILVSIDSLRADHLGAYGYPRATSPFFDQLAKKGILFENYFTSSYLTPISEASLHTGMYPTGSGVTNFDTELPESKTTLAEVLSKEGYQTGAIHTSPEFWFFPALKNVFSRGFSYYDYIVPPDHKRDLPDLNAVNSELTEFGDHKFFLWLTLGRVHWPYYGFPEGSFFTDPNYNGILKSRELDWDNTFGNIYQGILYPGKEKLTEADTKFVKDKYDEGIKLTDNFMYALFSDLIKRDLLKNTIVVIESEHGEDLGEHGYYAHYDVLDDQVHTPLLILVPGVKGKKIALQASSVDVLPTILSLMGRSSPAQVQGHDMTPVVCGAKEENRDVFIERNPLWEEVPVDAALKKLREKGVEFGKKRFKDIAIRTPEWKYIIRFSAPIMEKISWWGNLTGQKVILPEAELYDLKNDPGETVNVISDHKDIAGELRKKLLDWYANVSKDTPAKEENKGTQIQTYF